MLDFFWGAEIERQYCVFVQRGQTVNPSRPIVAKCIEEYSMFDESGRMFYNEEYEKGGGEIESELSGM